MSKKKTVRVHDTSAPKTMAREKQKKKKSKRNINITTAARETNEYYSETICFRAKPVWLFLKRDSNVKRIVLPE